MPEYQLQIKQVVDYPRCRIYREFIHKLINDRSIRINGGSGLFHFTVLCSYANFRTSYRRIDGISYTVSPGEWVCTVKELSCWFRTRFHRQALSMLDTLQKQHLISYTLLGRGNVVKYKILHWARHNSALEYNAPCQKDTGFFFLPVSVALELVSSARCSEMDIVLDLWVSAVYNDTQVQGSEVGPVAYFRNGTGNPLVSYTELSCRWGLSRATVCRILKKLDGLGYISIMSFPGRHGSVIYLQNYLSTMFEISDVLIDKEEVAMTLNIHLELPETAETEESHSISEHEIIVSDALSSVSKSHIETILRKMADILSTQGISCFSCPLSRYKLYPLSDDCWEELIPRARGKSTAHFCRLQFRDAGHHRCVCQWGCGADYLDFGSHPGLELPKTSIRGSRTVCAARCTGLHGSCGFFYGRQPDHSKHLEILVPDAWRPNFPIGHERLVPAPVHKHGGVLPCEPAFVVRSFLYNKKRGC